ncbi:F-box/LRR-repeat protein 15 [Selaginella moellendorffii]|uniref:F-box/LRR-repeat protein 15 n=1 Tax=Selaginella moellendorffii TaxID=88036 RepID=UPI000D1C813C|nr:F-box/LRR-repeat protein 15 [Selaginella moellendorffii]|eukprot:XP_024523229.1 F-box/LRR-repeat protein 15 [Selaginella moellendorffii]
MEEISGSSSGNSSSSSSSNNGGDEWAARGLENEPHSSMPELEQQERRILRGKGLARSSSGISGSEDIGTSSTAAGAGESLRGYQSSAALKACSDSLSLGFEFGDVDGSRIAAEIISELGRGLRNQAEALRIMEEDTPETEQQCFLLAPPGANKSQLHKLSKRTKLVTFAARRKTRETQAFELQIQELRREMSIAEKEEEKIVPIAPREVEPEEPFAGEARMDLTDDLLHKVFSYLDDVSLCRAAIVCRQWRVASAHEDFWKILNFEGRRVTPKQVRNLCQRYPNAIELNLKCKIVEDLLALDAIRSLRALQVLSLGEGLYGDPFFHALSAECASLRTLSISDAVLGSGASQEIQIRHDHLLKLDIVKCRVLRVHVRGSHLQGLSLRRTGTAAVILHCPRLLRLDISSCHKLSDTGVRAAATTCPLLSELDISHCSYVSDETLREIAIACSNLRSLDASNCPNISLEGVRMPVLVSLTLVNCEGINSSSMTAISHCYMLEELLLDFCWLLTTVSLDLPRLKKISLTNCRKFSELALRSPALTSIDVTKCPMLNRIDISSSSLQKLVLNQQQNLATILLQCPSLYEVDLTDCDSLSNSLCEVFSNGGGCPRLRSLILDSCEGLTAIRLSSSSLLYLSLAGCRTVSSIDLQCPELQRLLLDGCDHLSRASLKPVGLRSLNLGICPHLKTLVIRADQMVALDLRGCGILRQAEIICPSLLSLDASYCSQLGDDCLAATSNACSLIQSLVLASCPSVGPSGLLALKQLPGLTVLDLSYTFLTDLSPIYEACPQLEVLRLSACKYLANDALVALHGGKLLPDLQELDLSYGSLDRNAIDGLLSECPHLKHVSLNGCSNVFDIEWPSASTEEDTHMHDADREEQPMEVSAERCLQTLNCVGCPNIKRVFIPSSAGCLHLSILNLSLSTNIKEVRLACTNLIALNLSNCLSLMDLKLDCPKLVSLCLQASGIEEGELEEAIRDCSLLETLDLRNCPKIQTSTLVKIRAIRPGIKRLYNSWGTPG